MGDIIRPANATMQLAAEVIGTAPVERLDVMHGTEIAQTVRPFTEAGLGRRIRVMWQGAEYRGRGRETLWQGKLTISGNRIVRFAPVNFLNPERTVQETAPGTTLAFSSVTTGNLAGIDLWLETPRTGAVSVETNIVSGDVDLAGSALTSLRLTAAVWGGNCASIVCRKPNGAAASRPACRAVRRG